MLPVTTVCTAVLLLLILILGVNTTRLRLSQTKEEDSDLQRRIYIASRAHGNLVEHAVPVLITMMLCELRNVSPMWLTAVGSLFVIARILSAIGMTSRRRGQLHVVGAGVTYLVELVFVLTLASTLL